jgi:DNA-binding IclR family transcriptional regulator
MIYVENTRSPSAVSLSLEVGSRIPIATTSAGRAYLAAIPERERADIMDRVQELDELAWPRIREGIEQGVRDYQQYGCTCSFGAWQKDVNAIAVILHPSAAAPPWPSTAAAPRSSSPRTS